MEIRQLRYFLAVAEELHFGRAAARLHMSQPPLSVHVGRLEQELGTLLFERTTRRVALTAAGRRFEGRARSILDALHSLSEEMQGFADGYSGELTVGFVSSANYTVLPAVVRAFRTQRPGVSLNLVPRTSGEQIEQLHAGELDVGIVRDDVPARAGAGPRLRSEVVFEERLVACLPAEHALAGLDEVTSGQIVDVPMISYPRSMMPGFVDRVASVLGRASAKVEVVEEVVHQETALGFVAAGVGASILPESVRHLVPESIVVVPLAGAPTTRLLAVRPADSVSAAADAFVAVLKERAVGSQ